MLSSIVAGVGSFLLMTLMVLLARIKKEKPNYKPPLGMTIFRSFLLIGLLGVVVVVFIFGFAKGNKGYPTKPTSSYTGQQLYDAVNKYRVEHGKDEIPLDIVICDNLVARYLKIKSGDVGHEGFEEWIKQEKIDQKYRQYAEIYIKDIFTIQEAINFWDGSPGHRLTMLEKLDAGCAYANDGTGVVIFGRN
jgi:hypothetical protein